MTLSVAGSPVMHAVIAATVAPIMAALVDIVLLLWPVFSAVVVILRLNAVAAIGRLPKALPVAANNATKHNFRYGYQFRQKCEQQWHPFIVSQLELRQIP